MAKEIKYESYRGICSTPCPMNYSGHPRDIPKVGSHFCTEQCGGIIVKDPDETLARDEGGYGRVICEKGVRVAK